MKVSIRDIEKTTGLLKKETHKGVCVTVTLAPEEVEVIERVGLDKIPLNSFRATKSHRELSRKLGNDDGCVAVAMLVAKNGQDIEEWFSNNLDITNFKAQFKDELRELKVNIERFATPSEDENFEL